MTTLRTDLVGATRESARRIRFEPSSSIPETDVQEAIENVQGQLPSGTQRTITAAGTQDITSTDLTVYVNRAVAGSLQLPTSASWLAANPSGISLLIKDINGSANTNNQTILPDGLETIDGAASFVINTDYGGLHLSPISGGGWSVV